MHGFCDRSVGVYTCVSVLFFADVGCLCTTLRIGKLLEQEAPEKVSEHQVCAEASVFMVSHIFNPKSSSVIPERLYHQQRGGGVGALLRFVSCKWRAACLFCSTTTLLVMFRIIVYVGV